MSNELHVISLGAGVQSSAMALMAAHGEIEPMPAAAIFADTQGEPKSVYTWLDWLEDQLPFPVIRATGGDLAEMATTVRKAKSGNTYLSPSLPVFVRRSEKRSGEQTEGIMRRQCTEKFKILVVRKAARELLKERDAAVAITWVGISYDEVERMKPSRVKFMENIWPLVERRISRHTCIEWMKDKGYPEPPRSACVYCPYHSDREWHRLKTEQPEDFAYAVDVERRLRAAVTEATALVGVDVFLHRSLEPLDEVTFDPNTDQLDLFGQECEGMCGV